MTRDTKRRTRQSLRNRPKGSVAYVTAGKDGRILLWATNQSNAEEQEKKFKDIAKSRDLSPEETQAWLTSYGISRLDSLDKIKDKKRKSREEMRRERALRTLRASKTLEDAEAKAFELSRAAKNQEEWTEINQVLQELKAILPKKQD